MRKKPKPKLQHRKKKKEKTKAKHQQKKSNPKKPQTPESTGFVAQHLENSDLLPTSCEMTLAFLKWDTEDLLQNTLISVAKASRKCNYVVNQADRDIESRFLKYY